MPKTDPVSFLDSTPASAQDGAGLANAAGPASSFGATGAAGAACGTGPAGLAGGYRRRFGTAAFALALVALAGAPPWLPEARALDLSGISSGDAAAGLREALGRGADVAVSKLGVTDGFLGNPKVKIPLPDALRQAEKAMKLLGQGERFTQLEVSMNRAAESAVAQAKPILTGAIRSMSVSDAKGILTGGEDSVTQFFRSRADSQLLQKFLPIVTQTTGQLGLARQYNSLAGQAKTMGLLKGDATTVEGYVTRKAVDGLYTMIADEEKAIRKDPVGTGSAILRRVFGS